MVLNLQQLAPLPSNLDLPPFPVDLHTCHSRSQPWHLFEQKKKTQNASSAVKHSNTAVLDPKDLLAVHTTYQGALTTVCYCATLSVFSCVELK